MKKNYSYVSLLTNDTYVYGIILLVESMKKVKTKYPLHVLVTKDVSTASLEILTQLKVTYEKVDIIETPEDIYEHNLKFNVAVATTWKNCWTKFRIFNLTQFDKIVFLDADIMILKNLDHLFKLPHMTAALDGEYFNIWPGWDHFNSGCLVIEPSNQLFENILQYGKSLKVEDLPEYIFADQEVLNFYYKDWPEKKELHLNKYYNIFPPYVQSNQVDDLSKNAYFVHYVGRKPWTFWLKNSAETYDEYFYTEGKNLIESSIVNYDWQKIRSCLKLTVYAICKNEINNIKKWLESFGEADYVCILDTGSTDGTWEYLQEAKQQYNNLIIDQQIIKPWRYDKARNISMTLIPEDTTIFFMADLDEVIKEKGWTQKVKDVWDPQFDRGQYTYHRDINENGTIIRTIKEYRIHSKNWHKWVNIVHEALVNQVGNKQFYIETCTPIDITVWHYSEHKENNYMELCEQDLEEYPDDWIMRLQLAIEYEIRNENEKALEHYNYIITHKNTLQPFEKARCYNGIAKYLYHNQKYQEAEWYYSMGRIICHYFADNYIEPMEMLYNLKQGEKVIELGQLALKSCVESYWCSVYDINNYYLYYLMGLSYFAIGDRINAISYLWIAYTKNNSEDIKKLLFDITNKQLQNWK